MTTEAKCVPDEELLDEVIAVYEKHGWSVRRFGCDSFDCDGDPAWPSEKHGPAVVVIACDDVQECLCARCLHKNAEGWIE